MLAECGCLSAEFCAWHVKFLPSCATLALNLSVDTAVNLFPSDISSLTVWTPSVTTDRSESNQVICKGQQDKT